MTAYDTFLVQAEDRFSRWARRSFWRVVGIVLAGTVLYGGMALTPDVGYLELAADPFTEAARPNYHQGAPLLPLLAHGLGTTSTASFFALCLGFILGGYVTLALGARRRYGPATAALAVLLVAAHPVTTVLLAWVGMPDALTFLFAALLLFVRHPLVLAGVGVLGAFNHPILVFAAPALVLLRVLARDERIGMSHLVATVVGVVAGLGLGQWFLHVYDIEVVSRLDYVLARGLDYWLWINRRMPHIVFSGHGLLWLAIGAAAWRLHRTDRRYALALVGIQVAFLGVTFVTEDSTRVFALLAWAPALHGLLYALRQESSAEFRTALFVLGLLELATPGYYVWESRLFAAPFYEFYRFVLTTLWSAVQSIG